MWTQTHDLHSHSTHSDGEHDVETVARLMRAEGVRVWALTDHDTTAGWNEAQQAADSTGLHFIPGVEITCSPALEPDEHHLKTTGRERASASWHLLAFSPTIDPDIRPWKWTGLRHGYCHVKTVANRGWKRCADA